VGGTRWAAVVPVKFLAGAKSRLRGAVPGVPHDDLVLALVLDTVQAALACAAVVEVLVVSSDAAVHGAAGALGARVVADSPGAGLNPAFRHGAALARAAAVAALAGDLPALDPVELAAALAAAAAAPAHRSFVPDAAGTGTTLLTAGPGAPLDPRFGPGSAAAHARSGAVRLAGAWPTLRQDVDTPEDLRAAGALGLGGQTAALLTAAARRHG
jgi:2-phospho-L-lactate/phosphoenolpyruvate guanylyltransferase